MKLIQIKCLLVLLDKCKTYSYIKKKKKMQKIYIKDTKKIQKIYIKKYLISIL